jgi:hypothetical protein
VIQYATVVRECHWDEYQRWADVAAYLKPLLVPLVAGASGGTAGWGLGTAGAAHSTVPHGARLRHCPYFGILCRFPRHSEAPL